jgi:hypothetical protein
MAPATVPEPNPGAGDDRRLRHVGAGGSWGACGRGWIRSSNGWPPQCQRRAVRDPGVHVGPACCAPTVTNSSQGWSIRASAQSTRTSSVASSPFAGFRSIWTTVCGMSASALDTNVGGPPRRPDPQLDDVLVVAAATAAPSSCVLAGDASDSPWTRPTFMARALARPKPCLPSSTTSAGMTSRRTSPPVFDQT